MEWTDDLDAEWAELMADYAQAEPSIEAMYRRDDEIAELTQRVADMEARIGQFNPLLDRVKRQKERTE
jgi:hypothetical protein